MLERDSSCDVGCGTGDLGQALRLEEIKCLEEEGVIPGGCSTYEEMKSDNEPLPPTSPPGS